MYPWDIADRIAGHFDRDWKEVAAIRDDELTRLLAAIAEPVLPEAARESLIEAAVHRLVLPGTLDPLRAHHERLLAVLDARKQARLAEVATKALLEQALRIEADCDAYLAIAPGWAEGCEMEMRMLERALARATLALATDGAAAATGTVAACIEYVTVREQVDAHARCATSRSQAVTRALAHHREVSHLALRLLEVTSARPASAERPPS